MSSASNSWTHAVDDYPFNAQDRLCFDANIWLYVYAPQPPFEAYVALYENALQRAVEAGSRIYIDALVISEFMNTYAKTKHAEYVKLHGGPRKFKQFRKNQAFMPVTTTIANRLALVLEHCIRIETGFTALDVERLLAAYTAGQADVNDLMIADLCRRQQLTLVTHDGDFKGIDIPMLTANETLLRDP